MESSESTFIDSEEEDISFGNGISSSKKTLMTNQSADVLTRCSLDATDMEGADVRDKLVASTKDLPSIIATECIVQDEPAGEVTSKAEKDRLLLALQRRFEKHKVEELCDLNLDDTAVENESCAANFHDQCNASLELLANCSMPQFSDSCTEDSLTHQSNLLGKSIGTARDLDSTARFLELEKSCLTPNKPEDDGREYPAELSTDDLSTVSADADGGFLTGLTKLALMHATLNRDSITMPPFSPAIVAEEKLCVTDSNHIKEEINTSISSAFLDNSYDDQLSEESSAGASLNTTLDEFNMLEAFGAHYMVSAEKDLIKKGLENSMNVSLSKDQQDLLDSFVEQGTVTKPGVNRDISKAFEPCKDVIASVSSLKSEDFQFPKPLSTVAGSNSKTKYRHQTTPIKQFSPKPAPVSSGKFFGTSTTKTPLLPPKTKFFTGSPLNGNRESPKTLTKTPVSAAKMTDLKRIESPIGHYIHDSPVPSLMSLKHVPFSGLQKKNKVISIETNEDKKASAENIDLNNMVERNMVLPPQKSYQSTSSLQKMTPSKTKLPLLSGKSKQLVSTPKAMVMKHTGRVKASDLPSYSPLSKVPATVNDSCFAERTLDAEVSVVVAKEATKSSTIK